ncbi:hypothetical protein [Acidipropionibacterium thoenii]|uniref:hypothetical protein n=1 Tax=Acidipropionibacterium thoenii TaxID=1751 RepID=UPI0003F8FEEE|nr:hypothetical protein [Acidipropionibacterium thoenii]
MRHKWWWGLAALVVGAVIGGQIGARQRRHRAELWAVATEGVSSADPHPRWF